MDKLLEISLRQGNSFIKYQDKIKKSVNRSERRKKNNSLEGFTNILAENSEEAKNTDKLNQQEIVELQKLEAEFNAKMKEYVSYEKKYASEIQQQLKRIDPKTNPYLNKNVKLQKGEVGYVTNMGVYKLYPDMETFNSTSGKNGCPSGWTNIPVDGTNTANNPGKMIPTDPNLLAGQYMTAGQSCGYEGTNVYVSDVATNPSSKYVGCYADTDDRAMIWDPNAVGYTSYDNCQNYALNNGYKYFGMQDMQSDGKAMCMVSNDLDNSTKYGQALPYDSVAIWSSNTSGYPGSSISLTNDGSLVLTSSDGNVIFKTQADASCSQGYSQSTGFDSGGNDINYLTPMSIDQCQQTCNSDSNCKGFVWNKNANNGCWLKADVSGMQQNSSYDLYKKLIPDSAACVYQLAIQDDGNMIIYKNNSEAIWATNTNGKQQISDPSYVASNGKYGINYMQSGQVLGPGEWIGSNTGNLRLVMGTDGNLVLYTFTNKKTCVENSDGKLFGSSMVNAIYELINPGDVSLLGKIGYVDQNSNLREYPSSMLSYSNNFLTNTNYDSPGNDLLDAPLTGINEDDCKTQCINNDSCAGVAFDYNNNICYLKNSNTYPVAKKQGSIGVNLSTRIPNVKNAKGCGRSTKINNIDSIQYANYVKGSTMTEDTDCTYNLTSSDEKNNLTKLKQELYDLAQKINQKITYLENDSLRINEKMGVDKNRMMANLNMYNNIKSKLDMLESKEKEGMTNMSNDSANLNMYDLKAMINDSNLIALQENYQYVGWSILAILLTIFTINSMRK